MEKREIRLEKLIEEVRAFYDPCQWHFLTLNGIDLGEGKIELQWIFTRYGTVEEPLVLWCVSDYETPVPSLTELIPSAIMGERETVDMFGVTVEGVEGRLYLSDDSMKTPLRTMGLGGCEL